MTEKNNPFEASNNDVKNNNVQKPEKKSTQKGTVIKCDSLRIRKRPSTKAEVIGLLKNGEQVEVELVKEGWATLANGKGFVMAEYLNILA